MISFCSAVPTLIVYQNQIIYICLLHHSLTIFTGLKIITSNLKTGHYKPTNTEYLFRFNLVGTKIWYVSFRKFDCHLLKKNHAKQPLLSSLPFSEINFDKMQLLFFELREKICLEIGKICSGVSMSFS